MEITRTIDDLAIWHSGKGKTMKTLKRSVVVGGAGKGEE